MGNFLIALSGARREILEKCPTEKVKFQSLGWAILITCAMATVSMWFALTSVMGFSAVVSFPFALIWGLVIMGIDRWLVTSMPADGSRKFLIALPRLVLALLLGSLISTPIVLRIFQSEINNQITIIKAVRENQFLSSQEHGALVAQINQWTKTVNALNQVIASGGSYQVNPADDPEVQGLTTQLNNERTIAGQDYHSWQCQLYGGCGAPKGSGPLAAASEARYNADEAEIGTLTQEIQTREQLLRATDASSQATRLQQAISALPGAKAHLAAVTQENDALTSSFNSSNNKTNGLLIRLEALDQLAGSNPTLNGARLLLFLLFLVIECLPVTVKLLQQPGNYERLYKVASRHEFNEAHRSYRDGTNQQPDDLPAFPDHLDSDYDQQRDASINARLASIWRTGQTRLMTSPGWETTRKTNEVARPRLEPGPSSPQQKALHRVVDTRDPAGFTHSRGTANANSSAADEADGAQDFGTYEDHDL
jgi:hypothetical protein